MASQNTLSLFTVTLLVLLSLLSHATSSETHNRKTPPFEFLNHLNGCHKVGDQNLPSQLPPKATGTLDAKTVSRMTMPRCGVPDIINVAHFSFFSGNPKWPSYTFATWARNTHFSFSQAQSYENADLKISFGRGDHGDGAPFDGRGGTLAHAFPPNQWEIPLQPWAVGAVEGAYDLETVALHEIGHLLGLGHSSVEGAVMSSGVRTGFTQSLHADDIQGIKALCNT
ncbi:unnamed protein product [Malus baccata var. baccata]